MQVEEYEYENNKNETKRWKREKQQTIFAIASKNPIIFGNRK